ncbi:MAG TPA: RsmE family RNA methyltransferase [bacterium]|jgi:16S rRNA (uracil1498-N3)-methyltransferase|nr:RsmE family RNA methyltransferase [bacterium]
MHQLFVDTLPAEGGLLSLEGDERHYLGRALRARPGERFRLAAADGSAATALLESFSGDAALLRVGASDPDPDLGLRLSLDLCPPRGDALDEALEMAVQLGLERLRLVRSERTLAAPDQGALQPDKLVRRLREACRQCLRARLPVLEPSLPLEEGLNAAPGPSELKLVMSERGGEALASLALGAHSAVRVLVGPEGGFTAAELDRARAAGWRAISLGPHPLKTATAVAAALASLRALSAPLLSPPLKAST